MIRTLQITINDKMLATLHQEVEQQLIRTQGRAVNLIAFALAAAVVMVGETGEETGNMYQGDHLMQVTKIGDSQEEESHE